MKLTDKQTNILANLFEGSIHYNSTADEYTLVDADKNRYFVKPYTVKILLDGGYIKQGNSDIEIFNITKKGADYIVQYCREKIEHLK